MKQFLLILQLLNGTEVQHPEPLTGRECVVWAANINGQVEAGHVITFDREGKLPITHATCVEAEEV